MKTVVIWDSMDGEIKFFVAKGDLSRFHGHYVNSVDTSEEMGDEISNLMYDQKTGKQIIKPTTDFPIQAVLDGAKVIVTGFLP